jgi:hypothetical protein
MARHPLHMETWLCCYKGLKWTYDLSYQMLLNMDFLTTPEGAPFITRMSVRERAKGVLI